MTKQEFCKKYGDKKFHLAMRSAIIERFGRDIVGEQTAAFHRSNNAGRWESARLPQKMVLTSAGKAEAELVTSRELAEAIVRRDHGLHISGLHRDLLARHDAN